MKNPYRFGFSIRFLSMTLSSDVVKAVAATKRLSGVDICPEIFEKDSKGTARAELKRMLKASGLIVETFHALFGNEYDFSSLDEAHHNKALRAAESAIPFAADFASPIVVVHASGEPIPVNERPARLARSKKELIRLSNLCRAENMKLAVEFLPRTCLGNSVDELIELAGDPQNDSLGICLDSNHMMGNYKALPDCIRKLGKKIFAMHISDCDRDDEKHWLPGKGVIDWMALMLAVKEVGFRGPFIYECVPDGADMIEKIQCLDRNVEWLCKFIGA